MPLPSPAPIPEQWRRDVIAILRTGDPNNIEWTFRARSDWSIFGLTHQAYEHLIQTLSTPALLGREVLFMDEQAEVWEFLCRHPFGVETPLYAKIGLKADRIRIKIFSTHIDHSGKLLAAIKRLQRRKKP